MVVVVLLVVIAEACVILGLGLELDFRARARIWSRTDSATVIVLPAPSVEEGDRESWKRMCR